MTRFETRPAPRSARWRRCLDGLLIATAATATPRVALARDDFLWDTPTERTAPPTPPAEKTPPEPPRDPGLRFGARRELVWSGAALGSVTSRSYDGSEATNRGVSFVPGLDMILAGGISLGIALTASYGDSRGYGADGSLVETKTRSIRFGPRLGYVIPLGEAFALWPTVTLGIAYSKVDESIVSGSSLSVAASPIGAPSTSNVGAWVGAYIPLIAEISPRFFLGFGPSFNHNFAHAVAGSAAISASAEATTIGAQLVVGGTFGGEAPETQTPGAGPRREPRFGDEDTLVITNESSINGSHSTYAGTSSSTQGFSLSPSVDWFLLQHVSLGFVGVATYSSASGVQPDGSTVDSSVTTLGAGARLGVEIDLGSSFSLWPRAGLSLGRSAYNETSNRSSNAQTLKTWTLAASAPILAHVSTHFFAGIGPTFSTDLSGDTEPRRSSLRATTFGATGILGGWL